MSWKKGKYQKGQLKFNLKVAVICSGSLSTTLNVFQVWATFASFSISSTSGGLFCNSDIGFLPASWTSELIFISYSWLRLSFQIPSSKIWMYLSLWWKHYYPNAQLYRKNSFSLLKERKSSQIFQILKMRACLSLGGADLAWSWRHFVTFTHRSTDFLDSIQSSPSLVSVAFSQVLLFSEVQSVKSSISLFIHPLNFLKDVDFKKKYILLLNTYK